MRPCRDRARRLTLRAQATYRFRANRTTETEAPIKPHGRTAAPYASRALVPGPHSRPPALLGGLWLRHPPALRHGGRGGDVSSGHHAAGTRAARLECRLCAAVAPAQGWPLRREPQPVAALLPVPGDP